MGLFTSHTVIHRGQIIIIAIMSLTTTIETPSLTYEQPVGLYIDGKWVKGKEEKTFETINPTNEKPIVAVHEAGPDGRSILQPLRIPCRF